MKIKRKPSYQLVEFYVLLTVQLGIILCSVDRAAGYNSCK